MSFCQEQCPLGHAVCISCLLRSNYLCAGCKLIYFSRTYYVALLITNVLLRLGLRQEIPCHYHSNCAACSFVIEAIGYNLRD